MLFFIFLLFYWSELNVFKPIGDLDVFDGNETFSPSHVGSCSNDFVDDVFLIVKAALELVDDLDAVSDSFLGVLVENRLSIQTLLGTGQIDVSGWSSLRAISSTCHLSNVSPGKV